MTVVHKFLTAAPATELGPRSVRVLATTGAVDRMGEQVVQAGIDLSGFMANPIILYQHDPAQPVGRATSVRTSAAGLLLEIEFAPAGVSAKADEVCGLVKSGVLNGVSIGFDPTETEPMDTRQPRGPVRYLRCDLMEVSIVSIPANQSAGVVARAVGVARPAVRREGRRLSADTRDVLREALAYHENAMASHHEALKSHVKCANAINGLFNEVDEPTQAERQATVRRLRAAGEREAIFDRLKEKGLYL